MALWEEEESEKHCSKSWRYNGGARVLLLANILSMDSANICRIHIVSQTAVGMGTGVGGHRDALQFVVGTECSQVVMLQSDECPNGGKQGC